MEKEVVYKPVIDASELPRQLEEIQAQLNATMGSQSFSALPSAGAAGGVVPSTFALAGGGFSESVSNFASQTFAQAGDASTYISDQARQTTAAMSFAANKFQQDFSFQGGIASIGGAFSSELSANVVAERSFDDSGQIGAWLGSLGFGYDENTAGMTKADYRAAAKKRMESAEVGGDLLAMGAGTAAGLIAGTLTLNPYIGAAAGFATDFVVDKTVGAAYKWLRRDDIQRERLQNYIQAGSFRFAGGSFSDSESKQLGYRVQELLKSEELDLMDIEPTQAESMIAEYTGRGGFDSVRSVEEYTQKVKELMGSSQKVAQLLHTSLQDAAGKIAEMEVMGITSTPRETLDLIQRTESLANTAGMGVNEFHNLAMQGASAVRGTGIGFDAGYLGIQDAVLGARHGLASGAISQDFIRHAGGIEGAASMVMQQGISYGQSQMALAFNASNLSLGTDLNTVLSTAVNNISSPQDVLGLIGGREKYITEQGTQALATQKATQLFEIANLTGLEINTKEDFYGIAQLAGFASNVTEAEALLTTLTADPGKDAATDFRRRREIAAAEAPGLWDKIGDQFDRWGHSVGEWWDETTTISKGSAKALADVEVATEDMEGITQEEIRQGRREASEAYNDAWKLDPAGMWIKELFSKGEKKDPRLMGVELIMDQVDKWSLRGLSNKSYKALEDAGFEGKGDFLAEMARKFGDDIEEKEVRGELKRRGITDSHVLDQVTGYFSGDKREDTLSYAGKAKRAGAALVDLNAVKQLQTDLLDENLSLKLTERVSKEDKEEGKDKLWALKSQVQEFTGLLEKETLTTYELSEGLIDVFNTVESTGANVETMAEEEILFDNKFYKKLYDETRGMTEEEQNVYVAQALIEQQKGLKASDPTVDLKTKEAYENSNEAIAAMVKHPDIVKFLEKIQAINAETSNGEIIRVKVVD